MAFSLFGKKPPPSPLGGKTAARPRPKLAPEPAPELDELASLDFTRPGEMPAAVRSKILVQEVAQQVPPVIEQAAMLFSAEQNEAACAALAAAVREENLGGHAPRAWGMLFELYQLLGRRAEFEQLAVDYAARFETSPPTWAGAASPEPAARPPGMPTVSLPGILAAKVPEALKQLFRNAEKGPVVRLDVARATEADEEGCALLNEALHQLKRTRKECVIAGADKAAAMLAKKISAGVRANEQAWLLLLELYQRLGDQPAFEDAAVDYAITFEVSPPSWESARAKSAAATAASATPAGEIRDDGQDGGRRCALEGCIAGAGDEAFEAIRAGAATGAEVVVDVSRLQRMDFVAAANLMNLVNELALQEKKVRLVKASQLITALWEVIGLDRVARIETRKA